MNQPWSDYDSDWFIGLNSSATNIVVAILINQLNKREIVNISEGQSSSPTGPGKKRISSDTRMPYDTSLNRPGCGTRMPEETNALTSLSAVSTETETNNANFVLDDN